MADLISAKPIEDKDLPDVVVPESIDTTKIDALPQKELETKIAQRGIHTLDNQRLVELTTQYPEKIEALKFRLEEIDRLIEERDGIVTKIEHLTEKYALVVNQIGLKKASAESIEKPVG